jgi:hypothetical protein
MILIFPVLGVIALLVAVWAVLFYILGSQRVELTAQDQELEAKTDFMSKWRKGRVKSSLGTDVRIIRPKQTSESNPDQADEVRSA